VGQRAARRLSVEHRAGNRHGDQEERRDGEDGVERQRRGEPRGAVVHPLLAGLLKDRPGVFELHTRPSSRTAGAKLQTLYRLAEPSSLSRRVSSDRLTLSHRCRFLPTRRHPMPLRNFVLAAAASVLSFAPAFAGPIVLDPKLHHLRAGTVREWSDFPAEAEGSSLTVKFQAKRNAAEQTLRLRQQDVKQTWKVHLNGTELGRLIQDENDTELVLPVPAGRL